MVALVGLAPAIARPAHNGQHNDVAVYAIDADPATGMVYRVAQAHGTVVRYLRPRCHGARREVRCPVLSGTGLAGNGTDASGGSVKFC